MNSNNSNALVPLKTEIYQRWLIKSENYPLYLCKRGIVPCRRQAVREQLPDILGRVLARIWIDEKFHHDFSMNPRGTLETNGVFLPETMDVEFQKPNSSRPRIVVYEKSRESKFRTRIFYLQLVMMAGR